MCMETTKSCMAIANFLIQSADFFWETNLIWNCPYPDFGKLQLSNYKFWMASEFSNCFIKWFICRCSRSVKMEIFVNIRNHLPLIFINHNYCAIRCLLDNTLEKIPQNTKNLSYSSKHERSIAYSSFLGCMMLDVARWGFSLIMFNSIFLLV